MKTYCGADCTGCRFEENCKGCCETCGSPFGGKCIAAEYIKSNGIEAYKEFKKSLMNEINALLSTEGIPATENLFELIGSFVNLEYTLPNGGKTKFLDDKNIYLGAQIEVARQEACYGVIADMTFILVCRYKAGGAEPEIILYKRR